EDGLREFIKRYYPQVRKEGLIVDIRSNGGGSVSWMLLERLRRVLLSVDFARTNDDPLVFPYSTFHGHQVTLINESTSSDGDMFAAMFKRAGLGPLIGTRTWGGVVGIGDRGPLIDGGAISVPESASASPEGQYIIEGYGVDPDIRVENDPKSVIDGRDPQLEKGVEVLLEQMAKEPRKLPTRPAPPVKTQAGGRQ
ncbi:MAG TPA: S41 family peptidase, partial [Thermoanaerobaculia bacterium]|nr:S41 family peptidase [Thermoanaerobaculia bacterium]